MQIGMRARFAVAFAAVSLLGLAAGCEEEKKNESGPADAGLDAGPQAIVGGKLGEAVAAAAAGSAAARPPANAGAGPGQGQGQGQGDGPPESGVFAPGASEAVLPKATPYTLEMLGEGSEPRARLAPRIDPKAEQKRSVVIGVRSGQQQGLPSFDIELALKPEKPKDDKAKAGEGAPPPTGTAISAKVLSVLPAAMGLGGPPKELTDIVGKLKGSVIRYRLSPTNAMSELTLEPAKGADAGIAPLLDALAEAISVLNAPLPDKPVGVGAYWMVADRALWPGAKIPILRYRVFKVTKIEGEAVTFSVDTRQYAEEGVAKLSTGREDIQTTIDAFQSSGKGTLVWEPGALAPREAELTQQVQARLVPPGAPANSQQRMLLQSELTARFQPPSASASTPAPAPTPAP